MIKPLKIGFTTSLPIEVIYAAGHIPIDLNNIFILNNPPTHVRQAELYGFPRNICAWIKGMYSVIKQNKIDLIIGIIQGDCSNTHSLMSILKDEGKNVIPFSYPWNKDKCSLEKEITSLENYFGVTRIQTQLMKKKLDKIRKKLIILDNLTWQTNQVSALENHLWLVTSSDFNSDYVKYEKDLDKFLENAQDKPSFHISKNTHTKDNNSYKPRLGFIGVPPILDNLYEYIEECQAKVVFNEIQRQFSMPYLEKDIIDQYHRFTYPSDIFERIKDIKKAISKRKIDGLIAYTQSFCHRQLDLISLRKHIDIPILHIEGDQPSKIDARTKLRIESFIEMISNFN